MKMYAVKTVIKLNAAHSAKKRVEENSSNPAISSSVIGTAHDTIPAKEPTSGDCPNCT
ncbi:hypothetical protein GCM10022250_12580 [Flavobacterium chungbukense]|uniref:Uncharacterized protein n=1 Tax=Flavobacterium chungbukense TaxID=877464 RepID=A0ABP7XUD4_9FLAO